MSSYSKSVRSSISSSSYVGEETSSRTSIRSSRQESSDLASSALSSVRRSTAITSSFDADDDLSFRRSSRTSALDDDPFAGVGGTRRSLRSRLDDDADSGIASIRRTSRLSSRDEDVDSALSSARRLTSRMSSKDDDEAALPSAYRMSSRTSSQDQEDGMNVKRSTKMSSSREEDDRYSLSKTKFSSSLDAEDENTSLSMRTKKSSLSYKEEDTSGSSLVKKQSSALSYSESFSSETKGGSSSRKVYEAIIDFEPVRSDKEAIPLKEGQQVEILDDSSKPRKWLVRTLPFKELPGGVEGWVPSCYLEKVRTKAITTTTVTELNKEYTDPKEIEASTKRAAVVKELVETEEDFSRDMQYVVRSYVRAIDAADVPTEIKNYKEELFGNFKAISEFHNNELIKGVQYYANEPSKLGITFLRLERDFDKHVNYCKNEPRAQEILETTALKKFFEEHTKKIKDDKTLSEHLKLPIQRINDYQLLLRELIKYSSRLNEDTNDLEKALELMQTIPQKASDAQFLNSIQGYKGNLHKFGRMLCHDWFEVTEGSAGVTRERYVFLFKGRVCITDVKKVQDKDVYMMKNIVKLHDVKVVEPSGEDKTLVIEHSSKSEPGFPLKLKARTSIQKESWYKELTVTAIPAASEMDTGAPKPKFRKSLRSVSCQQGETISLDCEVISQPPAMVSWLKDNKPVKAGSRCELVNNGNYHSLTIREAQEKDGALYTVVASDENGTISCSANLTVKQAHGLGVPKPDSRPTTPGGTVLPHAPVFKVMLKDTELLENTSVRFELVVRGHPEPKVTFFKDNQELKQDDRVRVHYESKEVFELIMDHVTEVDAGRYSCTAVNSEGEATTEGNITVTKHKILFQGLLDDEEDALKTPSPVPPAFRWFKDGKEFEASERFEVSFDDAEDTLALCFHHVKPGDAGLYTCVASTCSGRIACSAELTVQGLVNQLLREPEAPQITANLSDVEVSEGASAMLEVKVTGFPKPDLSWYHDEEEIVAGGRYKFLFEDNESTTLVIKNVVKSDSGSYRVVAKNDVGQVESKGKLSVTCPPAFKKQLKDTAVMTDEPLKLEVEVEGKPTPDIKWYKDGQPLSHGKQVKIEHPSEELFSLTIAKAKPEDAGSYSCIVSNPFGSQTGFSAVTVNAPPSFLRGMKSVEAVEEETITLSVKIAGTPKPTLKWSKDGSSLKESERIKIVEEETNSYVVTIDKVKKEDAGKYECEIKNEYGKDTTSGNVGIKSKPSFSRKLTDMEFKEGDVDVTLEVKVEGLPKPNIKWYHDGKEIAETKSVKIVSNEETGTYTLKIKEIAVVDAGEYKVEATNSVGKTASSGKISVNAGAKILEGLKDVNGSVGQDAAFTVKFKGNPKPDVKWTKAGASLTIDGSHVTVKEEASDTLTLIIHKVTQEDKSEYSVEVSNMFGKDTSTAKLKLEDESQTPRFTQSLSDQKAKVGEDVEFAVVVEGKPQPKIRWLYDDKEIQADSRHLIASDAASGKYTLKVKTLTESCGGKYTCEASNDAGRADTSGKLSVASPPKFIKGLQDQSASVGQNVTFNVKIAGTPKPKVTWMNADAEIKIDGKRVKATEEANDEFTLVINKVSQEDAGKYSCKITNEYGEEISSCKLNVDAKDAKPAFKKTLKDTEAREGDLNVEFAVEVEGSPAPKIKWTLEGTDLAKSETVKITENAETGSHTLIVKKADVTQTGTIKCTATNSQGSADTSAAFTVSSKPKFEKGLGNVEVNEGETVSMTVKVAGQPEPKVTWSRNGEEVSASATIRITREKEHVHLIEIDNATIELSGDYECKATNKLGEAVTKGKLTVNSKPVFVKGLKDQEIWAGEETLFEIEVKGSPEPELTWFKEETKITETERIKITSQGSIHKVVISGTKMEDSATYKCKATNKAGQATTEALLSVQSADDSAAATFIRNMVDTVVVVGDAARFEVKVAGNPAPTVTWYKNDVEVEADSRTLLGSDAKDNFYTLTLKELTIEDSSSYSCKAVNDKGEAKSRATLSVKEPVAPELTSLSDLDVKIGSVAKFEVTATGLPSPTITWKKDGSTVKASDNVVIVSNEEKQTYSVTIKSVKEEDTGSYVCQASNSAGKCEKTAKLNIKGEPPSFLKDMRDVSTKKGEDVSFEVRVGGYPLPTLSWFKGDKELKTVDRIKTTQKNDCFTLSIKEVTSEDLGTYSCKAKNASGEASSSAVLRTKDSSPVIERGLEPKVSLGEGDHLILEAKVDGQPMPEIQWLKDGKPLKPDAHTKMSTSPNGVARLEVDNATPADAGKYEMVAKNDQGEVKSPSQVSVKPGEGEKVKPKFVKPLEAIDIVEGKPSRLEVKAVGTPKPQVAWLKNGQPIEEDNRLKVKTDADGTSALIIDSPTPEDAGKYTCIATNPAGDATTAAPVSISRPPSQKPEFTEGLKPTELTEGKPGRLEAKVSGEPKPDVKWIKDGKELSPDKHVSIAEEPDGNVALLLDKVKPDDAGKYAVAVTNPAGEAKSEAPVTVVPKVDKPRFDQPLLPVLLNEGEPGKMEAKLSPDVKNPTVTWLKDNKPIEPSDHFKPEILPDGTLRLNIDKVTPSDSGKYAVVVGNDAGEGKSEAKATTVPKMISPTGKKPEFEKGLSPNKELIEGQPLKLEAKVTGDPKPEIKWLKDGEEVVPSNRVYTHEEPDGNVKLTIDHALPDDSGKYAVVAQNDEGKSRSPCLVDVKPVPKKKPEIELGLQKTALTAGQPGKLTAKITGQPKPAIKWLKDGNEIIPDGRVKLREEPDGSSTLFIDSVVPDDAGKYTVVAANENGEVRSSAPVIVNQPPIFIKHLQPAEAIEGYPSKLEALLSGEPAPEIKWMKDGKNFKPDGIHVKAFQTPEGSIGLLFDRCIPQDSANYCAVATNSHGEASSDSDLSVTPLASTPSDPATAPTIVTPLNDIEVKEGEPIKLEVSVTGIPLPAIQWLLDGQPIYPSDNVHQVFDGKKAILEVRKSNPQHAGKYEVKATNATGTASSQSNVKVMERTPPRFIQRLVDLEAPSSEPMKLQCRVKGFPEPEIEWTFNGNPIYPGLKYNMTREGDLCILTLPHPRGKDSGIYECKAKNPAGEDSCRAEAKISDKGEKGQPPMFLKKLGDCDSSEGGDAKFTACIVGSPAPDIKWFRNGEQLDFTPRHKFELESNGLLRLFVRDIQPEDFGEYRISISNPYGSETCTGKLRKESDKLPAKPIGDQYAGYDKFKKSGAPVPLPDKPRITRMSDDNLTLAWKPSVPIYPRLPVSYQVEHMRHPDGQWSPYKSGIRDSICDVRGLEPAQDYRYRIRVQNEHGLSDPSPYVTAHRSKLVPPTPGEYKPKDYEIEHPPLDKNAAAPRFLRKEEDTMYGIKGRPVSIEFWVYGYPQPDCTWYFNNTKLETGGKYDFLQDRNGQVIIFITRMSEDDVGTYTCHAVNEHGEARQKINLLLAEQPIFTQRLEETTIMIRRSGRLECRVIGKPYPKVKWFKDWQPLHESSRIKILWEEPDKCSLFLSGSILKDSGLYSCSATNIAGNAQTSAMVTIEENETEYDTLTYSRPRMVKPKTKPLGEIYDLGDELGRGTQGITFHAVERSSGKSYAAKVMTGTGKLKDYMAAEMDIMNQLNHHRLVRLWDSYETKASTSLVTDLCGGGELLDHILKKGSLTESEVAAYIRQVLEGLEHMHSKNIAHLGLTVGDILLARLHGDNIKIGDFGLAARLHAGRNYIQLYGHPEFVAPELVKKAPASLAADMWSVGVITYLLLSGISPFLGENDRETLTRVQDGKINFFHDAFAEVSDDARDFISKLLVFDPTGRLDIKSALSHPWLKLSEIPDKCDKLNNIDRLKDYYGKWKNWYANASCRNFYRRRTMESCFSHPSKMIYPPGEVYTPVESPEKELNRSKPKASEFDDTYKQKINREFIDVRSESLYQNGPDTYLLQLRDTDFPRRVRQYLRVGAARSPSLASNLKEGHWGDSHVAVRERRKFLDVMDEEIDDEKKGLSTRTIPLRLSHEIGTLGYAHEQIESLKQEAWKGKGDRAAVIGATPFFRERIIDVVVRDGQDAVFKCLASGNPKPSYSWFRNDGILIMSSRIKVQETSSGHCELRITPAKAYDAGVYKCVARNTHGVAICRARLKMGDVPGKQDAPEISQCTDSEIYVVWAAPRFSGNAHILCYKLEYKKTDEETWVKVTDNIEHEFYIVKELTPSTLYHFRVTAMNKFGWGVPSNPSETTTTTASGAGQKIRISKARRFQQDASERAKENSVPEEEEEEEFSYDQEDNPAELKEGGAHSDLYNFVSEITRGRFSMVVKTWLKGGAETLISKLVLTTNENETAVKREYEIMKSLCHKHIVRLIQASSHDSLTVLVMERLSGVDILTYLASKHQYNEETVAKVITQVLEALDYLHHRGICYLELQPDNVVLVSQKRLQVKLVDFGSAHFVPPTGAKVDFKGTTEYLAPEVLKKEEVSAASDIWGVAVLTYVLLSGVSPFRGETELETADNVSYVRYRFENLHKEVTQEATRFLMHIFKRTPSKRPTVEECLEHKWLLPSEFLLKKREHAVFLAHKIHEFSEQYHAEKQAATSPRLLNMFGMSFNRSISLENDTYEDV